MNTKSTQTTLGMTLYRGVDAECAQFLMARSTEGTFGSGLCLADFECAKCFSGDFGLVAEVRVKMAKPFHYSVPEDNSKFGDLPAIPLVEQLFPLTANKIIHQVVQSGGYYFGSVIEEALIAMGHDGLIVTFHDGSQEIVAFRNSITSLSDIYVPTGSTPETSERITHIFIEEHSRTGISLNQWLSSIASYEVVEELTHTHAA